MTGFLIPPWYEAVAPGHEDMYIASIVWGFTLACGMFTFGKAVRQSSVAWKRSRRVTVYAYMIWLELLASSTMGILSWLFLYGALEPSFQLYFLLVCLWVVQIQMLMQIIINRIALLVYDQRRITKLKWIVALIIGFINVSVFCIWIPARLQISKKIIFINEIWDRIEKVLFLFVDAGLSLYFIHLVRAKLLANGLTKYTVLFRFTLFMVAISLSLDVALIGTMSLPNGFVYVQFHPLVYLLKLHIEMKIADLIAKVVKATSPNSGDRPSTGTGAGGTHPRSTRMATLKPTIDHNMNKGYSAHITANMPDSYRETEELGEEQNTHEFGGIRKTVSTTVVQKLSDEDEIGSESSSTRHLKK